MKNILTIILVLFVVGCSSPGAKTVMKYQSDVIAVPADKTVYVKMEFDEPLSFQGAYDFDAINATSGSMAYPAYNGATFLAAIAVHAAASGSVQNSVEKKVIDQANLVVEKYQNYIDTFSAETIFHSIVSNLDDQYSFQIVKYSSEENIEDMDGWVLHATPVFYLTQDERELVVKNLIYFHSTEDPEKIMGRNIIEVASKKLSEQEPYSKWVSDDLMMSKAANLYALSLNLFIDDVLSRHKNESEVESTFRYFQGGEKLFERGQLVKQECGRVVVRTLRGWLLSLPYSSLRNSDLEIVDDNCKLEYFEAENLVAGTEASKVDVN